MISAYITNFNAAHAMPADYILNNSIGEGIIIIGDAMYIVTNNESLVLDQAKMLAKTMNNNRIFIAVFNMEYEFLYSTRVR